MDQFRAEPIFLFVHSATAAMGRSAMPPPPNPPYVATGGGVSGESREAVLNLQMRHLAL